MILKRLSRYEVHIVIVEKQATFQRPDTVCHMKQSGFVSDGEPVQIITCRINMFSMGEYTQRFRIPE